MRSRNPRSYPPHYHQLISELIQRPRNIQLPCESHAEAMNLRSSLYAYLTALHSSPEGRVLADRFRAIYTISVPPRASLPHSSTITISQSHTSPAAVALREAMTDAGLSTSLNPDLISKPPAPDYLATGGPDRVEINESVEPLPSEPVPALPPHSHYMPLSEEVAASWDDILGPNGLFSEAPPEDEPGDNNKPPANEPEDK